MTGLWRRIGYPVALSAPGAVSMIRGIMIEDTSSLRIGLLFISVAAFLFLYLSSMKLILTADTITMRRFLQGDICLPWDSIVRVRRSDPDSPAQCFFEFASVSGRTLMFNPYLFDRPREIIEKIEKRLGPDFFKRMDIPLRMPAGEIAVVTETENAPSVNWFLPLAVAILVIVGFFLFLKK